MRDRLRAAWKDPAKRPALGIGFGAVALSLILLIIALAQISPAAPPPTPTPTTAPCINCPPQAEPVSPKVLNLRGRSIFVQPVSINNGSWVPSADPDKAQWVFGTLINYVMGLNATQENSDMLQALSEADEITLDLSNGQTLKFNYAGRQFVSPGSIDIFSQQRPGLTLVLLGDNDSQRLVVTANYSTDSEVGQAVPSRLAQIGTPIDLGGVRVTVLSGRMVFNAPGVPVGSAFYLVDFSAENIGSDAIDAAQFAITLQDYANQKYRLSETASSLGPNAPPTGQILPGLSATFTAGFEVPTNVTGPVLVWSFKPTATFRAQADVAVPLIGPTPTPDPRSQISVQVTQAYFSPDQTEMIVVVGIGNPGNTPITLTSSDISLSTPDGVFAALTGAEPGLPTVLQPGQNQAVTLRFSRLPSNSSVLRVFLAGFQLNW